MVIITMKVPESQKCHEGLFPAVCFAVMAMTVTARHIPMGRPKANGSRPVWPRSTGTGHAGSGSVGPIGSNWAKPAMCRPSLPKGDGEFVLR